MKVIYFTAGKLPTTQEKADIAALNALAVAPFEIAVRSAVDSLAFGAGNEEADYVSGTVPAAYDDEEEFPVFDVDNPPAGALPATMAIVADGQEFAATGGTVTLSVADGVVTAEFTADP